MQRVYGHGAPNERSLHCVPPRESPESVPTIANEVPVTDIMSRQLTCASTDLEIDRLLELVVQQHIGCIPVVDDHGRPVGMVTKLDLVEQLSEADTGKRLTARHVMMPLAFTLGERATVAHAAAMMAAEDVHHVPIVDAGGAAIGLVSSIDIVRWLARNDGFGF
jgi:CBS domain-containing protein